MNECISNPVDRKLHDRVKARLGFFSPINYAFFYGQIRSIHSKAIQHTFKASGSPPPKKQQQLGILGAVVCAWTMLYMYSVDLLIFLERLLLLFLPWDKYFQAVVLST